MKTLEILRIARATGETLAAIDHVMQIGYSPDRAREAAEPWRRAWRIGMQKVTCAAKLITDRFESSIRSERTRRLVREVEIAIFDAMVTPDRWWVHQFPQKNYGGTREQLGIVVVADRSAGIVLVGLEYDFAPRLWGYQRQRSMSLSAFLNNAHADPNAIRIPIDAIEAHCRSQSWLQQTFASRIIPG